MNAKKLQNVRRQAEQRKLYERWEMHTGKMYKRLVHNPSTICNGRQPHLYIMKYTCAYPGCYKVGRTGDFDKRLKTLNGGHMVHLMFVAKYEGYGHLELLIHDELSPYRIQCSSREWFNVHVDHIHVVIKTIAGVCKV